MPCTRAGWERGRWDGSGRERLGPECRRSRGYPRVPADAVTASGSGLDPHISLRNVELQIARVGKVRGISVQKIRETVLQHIDGPDLGFLGEPGVNVLMLNIALESIK